MARTLSPAARMERSILTDFRKTLWIMPYHLLFM